MSPKRKVILCSEFITHWLSVSFSRPRICDHEKTAFLIGTGLIIPFGLSNVPTTFERLIEIIGLVGDHFSIFGYYRCIEEVIGWLTSVKSGAGFLESARVQLEAQAWEVKSLQECEISWSCGMKWRILSRPRKYPSIRKHPVPRDKDELRRFLGSCTYCLQYVPGLATTNKPLTTLREDRRGYE